MSTKPLHQVIHDLCGKAVVPLDLNDAEDRLLVAALKDGLRTVIDVLKRTPIESNRPNEVGNKIEPYVVDAINKNPKYRAEIPENRITGYPDILITEKSTERYTYVECKTYNIESVASSFRSFFLSGSDSFKVVHDARHLVAGFQVLKLNNEQYRPVGFKLVDAHGLDCTLKEEWNSNNKKLYQLPLLGEYNEPNNAEKSG